MIGLDLDEARVVAVIVDEAGMVQARATVDAAGDVAGAARAALRQIAAGSSAAQIGVASALPEAASITTAVATLKREFSGLVASNGVIAAGTAAVMAETWSGAAKGARDAALLAVADRSIAGIVRGGAPMTGARGRAPMIAWLALNPVEREDYRKVGCLEAEVAASGVVRRLIWRIKAGDESSVQEAVGPDLVGITLDHVFDAARRGDGVAVSVVRDTAKYLGMAAANLVAIVDPETLVLGGMMASAADLFTDLVRAELTRRLPRAMMEALSIVPASLGHEAAAIGAARLAAAALP